MLYVYAVCVLQHIKKEACTMPNQCLPGAGLKHGVLRHQRTIHLLFSFFKIFSKQFPRRILFLRLHFDPSITYPSNVQAYRLSCAGWKCRDITVCTVCCSHSWKLAMLSILQLHMKLLAVPIHPDCTKFSIYAFVLIRRSGKTHVGAVLNYT